MHTQFIQVLIALFLGLVTLISLFQIASTRSRKDGDDFTIAEEEEDEALDAWELTHFT